jgi:LacI family transcriptional regulator
VSKTTVSHVLSRNRPVSSATRDRVEQAIAALGYRPDGLARSLRTRRSHAVALIIPDLTNPFYPVLARGLEDRLAAVGYRTFVCNTDADREVELEYVADVLNRRVDGLVLDSFHVGTGDLQSLIADGLPLVWVGTTRVGHPGIDIVATDDERGAFMATRRLIDAGHRRVGMIQGTPNSGQTRTAGYRRALERAGLDHDPAMTAQGEWTRQGGAEAMAHLLSLSQPPTAVFCANDMMAIGALDSARAMEVAVPDDVALVGFDDIEAAALVTPALTTVLNPAYDIGQTAGGLLLDRMTGKYRGEPRTVTLPCRVVERHSG